MTKCLLANLVLVSCLAGFAYCETETSKPEKHSQPDGGSMLLPGDWKVIRLWEDAVVGKTNGLTEYAQPLLDAKKVAGQGRYSLVCQRYWFVDSKNTKKEIGDISALFLASRLKTVSQTLNGATVIQRPMLHNASGKKYWYARVKLSQDSTIMDNVCIMVDSVLYYLSLVYPADVPPVSTEILDDLLKGWQQGKGVSQLKASRQGASEKRSATKLANGKTITLPDGFIVIGSQYKPQRMVADDGTVVMWRLLNARLPQTGTNGTLQCIVISIEDQAARPKPISKDMAEVVASGLVEGMQEMAPQFKRLPMEFSYELKILPKEAVVFISTYHRDNKAYWKKVIPEIAASYGRKASTQPTSKQPVKEYISPEGFLEFISQKDAFAAHFPGKASPANIMGRKMYTVMAKGEAAYNVYVERLPAEWKGRKLDVKAFLRGTIEGRTLVGQRLLASKELKFHNCEALEFELVWNIEGETAFSKGLIFVRDNAIYSIVVACPEQTKDTAYRKHEQMRKSFRFLNADNAE